MRLARVSSRCIVLPATGRSGVTLEQFSGLGVQFVAGNTLAGVHWGGHMRSGDGSHYRQVFGLVRNSL